MAQVRDTTINNSVGNIVKQGGGLPKSSASSLSIDKNKKRAFYRHYASGMLDEDRITDEGWKSIYEYQLENGLRTLDELDQSVLKKYNVDTSLAIKKSSVAPELEFATDEPVVEETKDASFISKLLGSLKPNNTTVTDRERNDKLRPITSEYGEASRKSISDLQEKINAPYNGVDMNSLIKDKDPLMMALNSKLGNASTSEQLGSLLDRYRNKTNISQNDGPSYLKGEVGKKDNIDANNNGGYMPKSPMVNPLAAHTTQQSFKYDGKIEPALHFKLGALNADIGREMTKQMYGQPNRVDDLVREYETLIQANPHLVESRLNQDTNFWNFVAAGIEGTGQQLGMQSTYWGEVGGAAATGAVLGGATALALGNLGPQALTGVDDAILLPTMMKKGAQLFAGAESFENMFQIEAGLSYKDMIEQGIDADTAKTWATVVGLINAGIEVNQIGDVIKTLPGAKDIIQGITKKGLEEATEKFVKRGYKDLAKDYVKFIFGETGQEVVQEIVPIVATEKAKGKTIHQSINALSTPENLNRLFDTATQSIATFVFMGLPGAGGNIISIKSNNKNVKSVFEHMDKVEKSVNGLSFRDFQGMDDDTKKTIFAYKGTLDTALKNKLFDEEGTAKAQALSDKIGTFIVNKSVGKEEVDIIAEKGHDKIYPTFRENLDGIDEARKLVETLDETDAAEVKETLDSFMADKRVTKLIEFFNGIDTKEPDGSINAKMAEFNEIYDEYFNPTDEVTVEEEMVQKPTMDKPVQSPSDVNNINQDQQVEDDTITPPQGNTSPETVSPDLEGYSDVEKQAVGNFMAETDKLYARMGGTPDQANTMRLATTMVDAIRNKDFKELQRRLDGNDDTLSKRMFTEITGLPTTNQDEAFESIRSLDPDAYDEYINSTEIKTPTKEEAEVKQDDKAIEREKKNKERYDSYAVKKIEYNGKVISMQEYADAIFAEGFRITNVNEYGGFELSNGKEKFLVNKWDKDKRWFIKKAFDKYLEKELAAEEKEEADRRAAMTQEERDAEDAAIDHLFGNDKKPKETPADESIGDFDKEVEDAVVEEVDNEIKDDEAEKQVEEVEQHTPTKEATTEDTSEANTIGDRIFANSNPFNGATPYEKSKATPAQILSKKDMESGVMSFDGYHSEGYFILHESSMDEGLIARFEGSAKRNFKVENLTDVLTKTENDINYGVNGYLMPLLTQKQPISGKDINTVILYDPETFKTIVVQKKYYDYFANNLGLQLTMSGGMLEPIGIYDNHKFVGVLLPVRTEYEMPTEQEIKAYLDGNLNPRTRVKEPFVTPDKTKTTEVKTEEPKPEPSYGYHAGDLGKAENFWRIKSGNRSTGHFGTGTYFVSSEEKMVGIGFDERPKHKIDFNNYNLMKPGSWKQAEQLHDALKFINYNYADIQTIEKMIEDRDQVEAIEELISEYDEVVLVQPEALKDKSSDAYKRFQQKGEALRKFMDETPLLTEEDREEARTWSKKYDGTVHEKMVKYYERLFGRIEDNLKYGGFADKDIDNYEAFEADLRDSGLNISLDRAKEIMAYITSEVKINLGDNWFNNDKSMSYDSPSTMFMKALGYEGVDVRHIESYDNTAYGSVIYDLKGKDAEYAQTVKRQPTKEVETDIKSTGGTTQTEPTQKVKTLADYGMSIEDVETSKGNKVLNVSGETKPYKDILKGLGGNWYGKLSVWGYRKTKYPTVESLENAILAKIAELEGVDNVEDTTTTTVANTPETGYTVDEMIGIVRDRLKDEAPDGWKSGNIIKERVVRSKIGDILEENGVPQEQQIEMAVEIFDKLKKEKDITDLISEVVEETAKDKEPKKTKKNEPYIFLADLLDEMEDDLIDSGLADSYELDQLRELNDRIGPGAINDLRNNYAQEIGIRNMLNRFFEPDIADQIYESILNKIKDKGETSNDNRADVSKRNDTKQPSKSESEEIRTTEGERGVGEVSDKTRGQDVQQDTSSRGTTSTNESGDTRDGVRGESRPQDDVKNGSGNDGSERNVREVGNFRITDETTLHEGGKVTRFNNNVAAIKLVKQLDKEGRKATLEEQMVLAKYVGWGGITEAFDGNKDWEQRNKELRELLTDEEYLAARESRLNAHYTSKEVIEKMYEGIKRLGFKNGKILEPAVGSGNFFGLLPEEFFNSSLYAVELEPITGKIASYLYPDAKVNIMSYGDYRVPDNTYDLIISNVPFGKFGVHDKDYNKLKFSIHNYYFAKSLDKVKEGGIVAFITSHYTMDAKDPKVKKYINDRAELLGAIRLPNDAFSKNAGTQVTTDMIFLRKLKKGETSNNKWDNISEINGVAVNEYYADNPDMMLGEMVKDASMYGKKIDPITGEVTITGTSLVKTTDDIGPLFDEAISKLPENVFDTKTIKEEESPIIIEGVTLGKYDKIGSIVIKDDKPYMAYPDHFEEMSIEGKKLDRIKGMIELKVLLKQALEIQMGDYTDKEVNDSIKKLRTAYEAYIKKFETTNKDTKQKELGYISNNANKQAFGKDAEYARLAALEKYNSDTKKYEMSDVLLKRVIPKKQQILSADNAVDGLSITLNELGYPDVSRIMELTGQSEAEVLEELGDQIFKDPRTGTYKTNDDYLSGNVKAKLAMAQAYAKQEPEIYSKNVEALLAVQPKPIEAQDIIVRLGQTWVPKKHYEDFARFIFERSDMGINYISETGQWIVSGSPNDAISKVKYGTDRKRAESILEDLLNNKPVEVNVYVEDMYGDRKKDKVASKIETTKAMAKAKLITAAFDNFIFRDANRREALVATYNDTFNNTRLRKFSGEFLTFEGMEPGLRAKLRGYQKDAIARIVQGGNTLIAHTVGAGKTFELIGGAMELKRLGIANKPMFVVPNHLIEQWGKAFYQAYPNANVLIATKNDFKKENRKRLFSMISNNTYDAVIVAHSSFGMMNVSKDNQVRFMQEEIDDIEEAIINAKLAEGKNGKMTKRLEATLKKLKEKMKELMDKPSDNIVDFEELGIDYLFVDEAHNFKNLFFHTKMGRIAGVANSKAKRAFDMYMKTRLISEYHNGDKGIVFATGTPVSNSIAEMFTMQRYLQPTSLKNLGINHFDTWASMFGNVVTKPEIDKTGSGFRLNTRFSEYSNLPELKTLFRSFADIIDHKQLRAFIEEAGGEMQLPKLMGGKPITKSIEASEALKAYIEELVERSEAVAMGDVPPNEDNALKITGDGRKAALDMRLIDPSYADDPNSKLNEAIRTIYDEYQAGNKERTTQLVFSDLGTPKKQRTKAQKIKDRKIVKFNGYKTYEWYYDSDNELKYVVVAINKEEEMITKLYEDGEVVEDSAEEKNPDRVVSPPRDFDMDIDDVVENLGEDIVDGNVIFDIYNDIKQKLIKMGVPESEIAFIHDANTDLQKETLFEAVRNGEVRILLGSTAKMGEGMNVQDRLIALHHLDAPWKPSAIEQRNGRIIRFGNRHDEVKVYQYITTGSFDAYLWSMLERKAAFISSIMDDNMNIRKAKDSFDPVVLNAAEVKALASGNPLIKEKFDIDNAIEDLTVQKNAHNAEMWQLESDIKKLDGDIKRWEKRVMVINKNLSKPVDISGDDFKVIINGKEYLDKKEATDIVASLFAGLEKVDRLENALRVGDYNIDLVRDIEGLKKVDYFSIQGFYKPRVEVDINAPSGFFTRLANAFSEERMTSDLAIFEKALAETKETLAESKRLMGKPFPKEAELAKLVERQVELDNQLNITANPTSGADYDNTATDGTTSYQAYAGTVTAGKANKGPKNVTRDKVKPISEIIKDIENDLSISITSKRYRAPRPGVVGYFSTHSHGVRVKVDNNISVIAHEVGHYLDKKYGFSEKYEKELRAFKDKYPIMVNYKSEEIPGEVFAEFLREYLTTEEKAEQSSPEFYKIFTDTFNSDDKDIQKDWKMLQRHKKDITNWFDSTLRDRVKSTQKSRTEKKEKVWSEEALKAEMYFFDDLAPIRALTETVEEMTGQKIKISDNPYVLALNTRRAGMIAKNIVLSGLTDAEGNIIGKSMKEVLSKIDREHMDDFDAYLKAKHAITLNDYDIRVFSDEFSMDEIIELVNEYEEEFPQFVETAEELYQWWSTFIEEWVVKPGFMDDRTWEELQAKYPTYVPNSRVLDDTTRGMWAKRGFGNQHSPIKRIKGSAKDTYAVIESMMLYADKIVKVQKRNEVGQAVHRLYGSVEGLSEYLVKVAPETARNKYDARALKMHLMDSLAEEFEKGLSDADKAKVEVIRATGDYQKYIDFLKSKGFTADVIVDNTIDDIITYFTPKSFSTDETVFTVVDESGKSHFYYSKDPLFLEAMLNIDGRKMDDFVRLLGGMKRVFTTLTTGANPMFALFSNIWADVPEAMVYGDYKNPFEFGKALAKAMIDTGVHLQKQYRHKNTFDDTSKWGKEAKAYKAMGGGFSSQISDQRNLMAEMLNSVFPDRKKSSVKAMADYAIELIEQFNDTIETAPRLAIYNKAIAEYGDTYEGRLLAMYKASEATTNFLRRGKLHYTAIGQGTPFLNAGLQGLYKLNRELVRMKGVDKNDITVDGKRVKDTKALRSVLTKALLYVTLFEISQMVAYDDDEDYDKLPEYTKDGYYLFKLGDGKFFKIRKPRALSVLFGSTFRRGFKSAFEGDEEAWKGFGEAFVNTVLPPNPVTDNIFSPLIQAYANKSWTGAPIVSKGMEYRKASDQYDSNTTELSKFVAKGLSDKFGVEISPKKMDYVLQQYTGVIGQFAIPMMSKNKTVGGMLQQKMVADVAFSNDSISRFYDTKTSLDQAYSSYTSSGRVTKDFDPVKRYRYGQVADELSSLYDQIDTIKDNIGLTPAEKQSQEREIRKQMIEVTSEENLKPTAYDEFKVLYNRGQDITSKYKKQYEETGIKPNYTEDEAVLLNMYNIKVQDGRSELGYVNYQIGQIDKRIKEIEGKNTIPEAQKKTAIKKLEDTKTKLTDDYMAYYKKNYGIDIVDFFK